MKEFDFKRLFGWRTLKTAIAVGVVIILYQLAGMGDPTLACIAAFLSLQDSVRKTVLAGLERVFGTLIGGAAGYIFSFIPIQNDYLRAVAATAFVILVIVICNLAERPDYIVMAILTFLSTTLAVSSISPLRTSIESTINSLVGIIVAVLVNRFVLDPERHPPKPYPDGTLYRGRGATWLAVDGVPLLLVNKNHRLKRNFAFEPDPRALAAIAIMQRAAQKQGLTLNVVSGYRSFSAQRKLHKSIEKKLGKALAQERSAHAGYSEHESGLAFDFNGTDEKTLLNETFADTPEYAWLYENAADFGFIERYPLSREALTGYTFEPWHYRYVGVGLALKLKGENKVIEEYVSSNKTKKKS